MICDGTCTDKCLFPHQNNANSTLTKQLLLLTAIHRKLVVYIAHAGSVPNAHPDSRYEMFWLKEYMKNTSICVSFLKWCLSITAQELHAEGDVIDPAFRVNPDEACEERRIKHVQHLFIVFTVSFKDLQHGINKCKVNMIYL